jgi:seryl-tRNA synthetase
MTPRQWRGSSPSTPARTSRTSPTLDLKQIRRDPEATREALARKGSAEQIDELLSVDERRRALNTRVDEGRAEQNKLGEQLKRAASEGGTDDPEFVKLREASTALKEELKGIEPELDELQARQDELLAQIPNPPDADAPEGMTEEDAEVLREVGERPRFDFKPLDHLELGERHRWIDMEAAAETSGTRFAYLLGDLVMVEMALVRFALETLRGEGFTPVSPPVMVRERALYGTGFFPSERETIYEVPRDELFLTGTSEVALASLHADEILAGDELPIRYAGFSTCFRREAGAGGRDTRGIFRVHQFDKVEMYSFVEPSASAEEHERLLGLQEKILGALEIPYRVVDVAAGDLGASASRKFDCEAWIPSQERFREVTSCSNTTDYQARRLNCRYRPAEGASPEAVHTLNGTAVAVGRTLIALLENRQEGEGTVSIPAALQEYGIPERIPTV